ncbi:MAG: UMP kinase [Spirochaetes bacterium]|nr:UMP kinase [Spirochaetota bacterium]
MEKLQYKRILLKLSGEVLAGGEKAGIDVKTVQSLAEDVYNIYKLGVQIAIVIGGGNIFRGETGKGLGIDRTTGDSMGMLATVINALAFQDVLEKLGAPARVMTAIEMRAIAEYYIRKRAIRHLEKNRIILLAAGTGSPFFTTDSAASLRAIEIEADILMKATKVDGVYTKDPRKESDAVKIEALSYLEVLQNKYMVMDMTAISMCRDNNLPIQVFNLFEKGSLKKAVMGEKIGTIIHND